MTQIKPCFGLGAKSRFFFRRGADPRVTGSESINMDR